MKIIAALTALAISASAAYADGYVGDYAVITAVHPVYADRYVERFERQCRNVEVPVYGNVRGGSDGDVIVGAIIGGAIGNQFGGGSGQDAMTVLGAIVGANRAANSTREVVTGYRVEERCENVSVRINEPVVVRYDIQYTYRGVTYYQQTNELYTLGQRVRMRVSLD